MIKTYYIIALKVFRVLRLLDRIVGKIVEKRKLANKFWRERYRRDTHDSCALADGIVNPWIIPANAPLET